MAHTTLLGNLRRWALLTPLATLLLASCAEAIAPQPNATKPTPQATVASEVTPKATPEAAPETASKATPKGVVEALQSLPHPAGTPNPIPTINSPNSYDQKALNFQIASNDSNSLLEFYRENLVKEGYTERTINTVSGDWGFSIVFLPPDGFALGADAPQLSLVIQATVLSPESVNINVRYEKV
ncbi:MAG: hypothetical protein AAF889_08815 [Cyanobacteria bacterium P01_D01_bin.73]